jgi:hypothetical protein
MFPCRVVSRAALDRKVRRKTVRSRDFNRGLVRPLPFELLFCYCFLLRSSDRGGPMSSDRFRCPPLTRSAPVAAKPQAERSDLPAWISRPMPVVTAQPKRPAATSGPLVQQPGVRPPPPTRFGGTAPLQRRADANQSAHENPPPSLHFPRVVQARPIAPPPPVYVPPPRPGSSPLGFPAQGQRPLQLPPPPLYSVAGHL